MIEKVWRWKSVFLKISSPRAKKTLGEEFLRREPVGAESFFLALGEELIHREFLSSPRIFFTLGEEFFAESPRGGSRQRFLLSAKALFPVVHAGNVVVAKNLVVFHVPIGLYCFPSPVVYTLWLLVLVSPFSVSSRHEICLSWMPVPVCVYL
jgi:hypothetical protein